MRRTVRWWLYIPAFAVPLANSCAPPETGPVTAPVSQPAPFAAGPDVRIGIAVNVEQATISSDGAIEIADPAEGPVRTTEPGGEIVLAAHRGDVVATEGGAAVQRAALLLTATDSVAPIRINGRDYRGRVEVRRGDSGLVVINRVPLEAYLAGVVGAEMGKRAPGDEAALRAQAVVSRTYAVRNQGRNGNLGFDLVAGVNDQVYPGTINETPMASAAVAATRGEILTYDHQPIDAFFFSACGGRTEDGTAAFAGADRPYLRSVDDHDPNGTPWCINAPRFHWNAGWTGDALATTLRRTLAAEHLPGGIGELTDVQIIHRTASDRAAAVELSWQRGRSTVTGQAIRRVLAPPEGGWLRSTDFTIRIDRAGSHIERVELDGTGNGHGVGMCQWGAIGRSRGGEDYHAILTDYFPGTEIQRLY